MSHSASHIHDSLGVHSYPSSLSDNGRINSATQLMSLTAEQRDTFLEIENALTALQDISNKGLLLVQDTIALSRYRSQYLPINPTPKINLRNALSLAILLARRKISFIHHRRPQRIQLTVTPNIPDIIHSDPVSLQILFDSLITTACDIARMGTIDVFVTPGSSMSLPIDVLQGNNNTKSSSGNISAPSSMQTTPKSATTTDPFDNHISNIRSTSITYRTAESIHMEIIFDANDIGGISTIANALSVDCLANNQVYSNINPGILDPLGYRTRNSNEAMHDTSSYKTLLPIIRHIVLCLGGTISAGTGNIITPTTPGSGVVTPTITLGENNVVTPTKTAPPPNPIVDITGINTVSPKTPVLLPDILVNFIVLLLFIFILRNPILVDDKSFVWEITRKVNSEDDEGFVFVVAITN